MVNLNQQLKALSPKLQLRKTQLYAKFLSQCVATTSLPDEEVSLLNGAIRARDFVRLVDWADAVSDTVYSDVPEHFGRQQLAALIRKYPFTPEEFPWDREQAAWEKFRAAETRCGEVNATIENSLSSSEVAVMQQWLSYVFGYEPPLKEIYDRSGFGPGASIGVSGKRTNIGRKISASVWTCTPAALPYARSALMQDEHVWESLLSNGRPTCMDFDCFNREFMQRVELVHYNKITFVPKTAKTDRSIAVEPLLNGYVQKGVDEVMRARLRRVGIDLKSQLLNQRMAHQGSLPGAEDPFCTIDLSSASDTVSKALVRLLLPPEWYFLLDALRSPAYLSPTSEVVRYEKFSSMGNGFTFPLETALFAACVKACSPQARPGHDFMVYGDDIVVRQSIFPLVVDLLTRMGFTPNLSKTFSTGLFRESCGADYLGGVDVRPVALDFCLDSIEAVFKLNNLFHRSAIKKNFYWPIRDFFIKEIPELRYFFRPYQGDDDTGFEVEMDVFMSSPSAKWCKDLQCWQWKEVLHTPRSDTELEDLPNWPTLQAMAAVRGSASDKPYTVRKSTRRRIRSVANAGSRSTWEPGRTLVTSL